MRPRAYKKAGGTMSVGISPAASKVEHVMKYRLPTLPTMYSIQRAPLRWSEIPCLLRPVMLLTSIGGRLGDIA